jgi:hypothetical protein
MTAGTFNGWIEKSLDQLALLMPGRYAKYEISSGFIGPVEVFAYRSPGADERLETDAEDDYQKVTGNEAHDGSTDVSAAF